jgi:dihydroxyacetone kinase-like protein
VHTADAPVTTELMRRWLVLSAAVCSEQRDYLTQLDAAIGDADHGANMERGFSAAGTRVSELPAHVSPGAVLRAAGDTIVSTAGGASGALWGTAFRRAGGALGDDDAVAGQRLAAALEAMLAAVVELGVADEGDKTMVDALAPAVRALREAFERGDALADAVESALLAGERGMRATVPLQATKGRASYLGDRSIGHQDPGATSTVMILAALSRAVAEGP